MIESASMAWGSGEGFSGARRTPYLSIQDEKKRFASLLIVFMEIQPVTENAAEDGRVAARCICAISDGYNRRQQQELFRLTRVWQLAGRGDVDGIYIDAEAPVLDVGAVRELDRPVIVTRHDGLTGEYST
jgi:hypothetical protein